MDDKITEAEAALDALESPARRVKHARHDLDTLQNLPAFNAEALRQAHAKAVTEAEQEVIDAEAARVEFVAKIGSEADLIKMIDKAAQAVLDARGEAHTEENILPAGGA